PASIATVAASAAAVAPSAPTTAAAAPTTAAPAATAAAATATPAAKAAPPAMTAATPEAGGRRVGIGRQGGHNQQGVQSTLPPLMPMNGERPASSRPCELPPIWVLEYSG